jgi:hypothetical protein
MGGATLDGNVAVAPAAGQVDQALAAQYFKGPRHWPGVVFVEPSHLGRVTSVPQSARMQNPETRE